MFQTQSEHGSSRSVVVSTALISGLLLFSGCEAAPEVLVASSYSRAVPEVPTGKPPIARIEAACLGELCEEMVFTAGSSTDASGYAWTLDGMPYGTEEVVVVDLDLERDADSDGLPDGALFDLSVTVTGHGSDTARVAVLTTPMLPTERFETDSALTGQAGVVLEVFTAVLVVGYESCSQVVTVTNFSGCLTAGSTAGLAVATSGGSGVLGGEDLLYVPPSDLVASLGAAEGAAWDAVDKKRQEAKVGREADKLDDKVIEPVQGVLGEGLDNALVLVGSILVLGLVVDLLRRVAARVAGRDRDRSDQGLLHRTDRDARLRLAVPVDHDGAQLVLFYIDPPIQS